MSRLNETQLSPSPSACRKLVLKTVCSQTAMFYKTEKKNLISFSPRGRHAICHSLTLKDRTLLQIVNEQVRFTCNPYSSCWLLVSFALYAVTFSLFHKGRFCRSKFTTRLTHCCITQPTAVYSLQLIFQILIL